MAAIKKLLGVLGSYAEACRRDSTVPFQSTRNTDNLDTPSRSLQYLVETAKGLQDALQTGFAMGIKIAKFNLTKNLEDYTVASRWKGKAVAAKWDDNLKSHSSIRVEMFDTNCSGRQTMHWREPESRR
jgi:hypothetical protein